LGLTSRFIGQALAFDANQRAIGPLDVIDPKLGAVILAEIEFGQVPIEMLVVDVLVNADKAALEDREEAFKGVYVNVTPDVFALGVIDALVLGDRREPEMTGAIGHKPAVLMDVLVDHAAGAPVVEIHRPNVATALDKAHDLDSSAAFAELPAGLGRLAEESLVCLDGLAGAAQRPLGAINRGHGMADTVPEEPSGFHPDAQGPLKLAGRNTFLGRAKQIDSLKPNSQGGMAGLENGADPDGKGLSAGIALAEARTGGLARQAPNAIRRRRAERANRPIRPKPSLDILKGGVFVLEMRGGKNGSHGINP
jgi:hypothetical protein